MPSLQDEPDRSLAARAGIGGDTDAFGELVRRHQSRVRLFLRRLARNDAHADDLAQDCFLQAWRKLDSYRGSGSFAGWLMRIAWTTFLQARRSGERYSRAIEMAGNEPSLPTSSRLSDETGDLERLLSILSEEERAILVMSYACGMSHREISDATDTPVGTIKSIIHRCKERIRQNFEIAHHKLG